MKPGCLSCWQPVFRSVSASVLGPVCGRVAGLEPVCHRSAGGKRGIGAVCGVASPCRVTRPVCGWRLAVQPDSCAFAPHGQALNRFPASCKACVCGWRLEAIPVGSFAPRGQALNGRLVVGDAVDHVQGGLLAGLAAHEPAAREFVVDEQGAHGAAQGLFVGGVELV